MQTISADLYSAPRITNRRERCSEGRQLSTKVYDGVSANLVIGDRPPWIILLDGVDYLRDAGALAAAPDEVIAGALYEELLLAGRDRGVEHGLGIEHVVEGRGVGEARPGGLIDEEDDEYEDDGGEDLHEGRPLAPPCQRHILPDQRRQLLPEKGKSLHQLHSSRLPHLCSSQLLSLSLSPPSPSSSS